MTPCTSFSATMVPIKHSSGKSGCWHSCQADPVADHSGLLSYMAGDPGHVAIQHRKRGAFAIYSYYCPYKRYLLPMCFKCLYILPLYILCIYSFMHWKSGTSDLLVLMLFVLPCTIFLLLLLLLLTPRKVLMARCWMGSQQSRFLPAQISQP